MAETQTCLGSWGGGRWALLVIAVAVAVGCARSPEARKARDLDCGDRYFTKEQYREAIIEYGNVVAERPVGPHARA